MSSGNEQTTGMFTAKCFVRPAEHEDAQLAWSYVLVDENISEDVRKQIVYVGQFSAMSSTWRLGMHKRHRPEFKHCRMLIVDEHTGIEAEFHSLFSEFVMWNQYEYFSLHPDCQPGNFAPEKRWKTLRALEMAEKEESKEEISKVLAKLEWALKNKEQSERVVGEKAFVCSECGEKFDAKNTLERHQRVHKKQRFDCFCGRMFRSEGALHVHIELEHEGGIRKVSYAHRQKIRECREPCAYKRTKNLAKHLRKVHKMEEDEIEAKYPDGGSKCKEQCPFKGGTFTKHLRNVHKMQNDEILKIYKVKIRRGRIGKRMDRQENYSDEDGFNSEGLESEFEYEKMPPTKKMRLFEQQMLNFEEEHQEESDDDLEAPQNFASTSASIR